jgi:hypothetical protein
MRTFSYRKYHNINKTVDGIKFDSIKEASRYQELKLLEKAGKIKYLKLQPIFILQKAFERHEIKYRPITYKADFKYFDIEKDKWIVEDVKGMKTEVYKIKKKLFVYQFLELIFKEI